MNHIKITVFIVVGGPISYQGGERLGSINPFNSTTYFSIS